MVDWLALLDNPYSELSVDGGESKLSLKLPSKNKQMINVC